MSLKKQTQLTLTKLAARDVLARNNPFGESPEGGMAENVVPYRGKIVRMPFAPQFHNSNAASRVWKIRAFNFYRNSADETQLLIFKANGKVYRRVGGDEIEIFPGSTGLTALSNNPSVVPIANRLHVTDGAQYLIYDGWTWISGGLVRALSAPATALVGGGSLTGTFRVATSAVRQVNGVTIHESTRSPITGDVVAAAQNIRVTAQSGLSTNPYATHWSVYMSEVSTAANRLRRVATVSLNSATTDISALPATTNPFSPIRNDPPQASRVLFQWKNRLGMGDRTDGRNFWFTAFEEVSGNLNGAPEECVPGRTGSTTLSDLVNSWTLPDKGERLRAGCWHENFGFISSDRNGYVIQGEGGLLDGRALRDFFPLHTFSFGTAGPWAMISSTRGLLNFSPERKLTIWTGSEEITDIGHDIQKDLDTISDSDLFDTNLHHWTGNGRDWLVFISPALSRMYVYDFAALITMPSGQTRQGAWFHYVDPSGSKVTSAEVYRPGDIPFLLLGMDDGTVRQFDTECQPAHLGFTFVPNKSYLGSTVQNSPAATIRTAHYSPAPERFLKGRYLMLSHRLKETSEANSILGTDPTITAYYNRLSPDGTGEPANGVQLTLGSRIRDKEQRAWLAPTSTASGAGAIGKRYTFDVAWPAGADVIADGSGRNQFFNNELLTLAFSWEPTDLMML